MRYLKHIKIILSISLIAVCIGCNDMDKIHEQYLGGEIIYSGKLDTLLVRPGMYRAQLEGYTHLLGNSNKVIIEFDSRTEVFDIDNNVSEIYSVIIENLEEDFYEFDVTTQDQEGNVSVPQTVSGYAVGDIFVEDQSPREINDFSFESDGNYVNFFGNAESEFVIFTTLDYDNENNEVVRDTLFFEDDKVKLIDFLPLGNLTTQSYVQSGLRGIDTIALEPVSHSLPNVPYSELDKDFIQIVDVSGDNNGQYNGANPQEFLFDGNGDWDGNNQETYYSQPGDIPHHFTVDLGVNTVLRKVKLEMPDAQTNNLNNATRVQIWGRQDLLFAETNTSTESDLSNAGWLLMEDVTIDGENQSNHSFLISPQNDIRYVKYRVVSTVGDIHSQLTEMTFYGQNTEPITHDKSLFSIASMPSDNPGAFYSANPSDYLWDGNSLWSGSDIYGYHSGENAVPGHFTIDLGVVTQLRGAKLHFRDPSNYSGNNPTELEIWGRLDLVGATISPSFQSIGNSVVSAPTSSSSLIDAGWILLSSENMDGANLQSTEYEVQPNQMVRYLKIRYVSTVAGSGCQFIEVNFEGNGAIIE